MKWMTSAQNAVQANSMGGYVNYVEPETPAAGYFGDNLVQLRSIRQTYDPGGLMCSVWAIGYNGKSRWRTE